MEKRMLGNTGLMVSALTFGGIVSTDDGYDGTLPTGDGQERSDMYVEYAVKNGVNYFDVAPKYGNAQGRLGRSLMPYRKDIYLACKTLFRTAEDAQGDLENSLRLLHTDYFDVYQMHCLTTVEQVEAAFSKGGCMDVMLRAKEEGIVRHLGITCHTEEATLRALSLYDFDTLMFPTNWALHLRRGFGSQIIQTKKIKNIGLLGMKSMIHRAWLSEEERYQSRFPKSWCKPVSDNDALALAAMKYAFHMGIDTLVPPGDFEHFRFAVEHIDECLQNPLLTGETELLRSELADIDGHDFL